MKLWHIAAVGVVLGVIYVLVKQQQATKAPEQKAPTNTNDVLVSGFGFLSGLTKAFAAGGSADSTPGPGSGNYSFPGQAYNVGDGSYGVNFGDV